MQYLASMKFNSLLLFLLIIALAGCQTYHHPETITNRSSPIGPEINTQSSASAALAAATIAPYQQQLQAKMDRVIGQISETLPKGSPESKLGNWLGDLLQTAAEDIYPDLDIAFSVQNAGGIRVPELSAGPLKAGNIYELMPFDNELVLVEMNGFVTNEFIQHMAASGGWPVSKELRYVIKDGTATEIMIKGERLELNRNYIVCLPDYVANGGSDSQMLKDRKQIKSNRLLRDLLLEYAEKIDGPITVELDGRVSKSL